MKVDLLGVAVENATMDEALRLLETWLRCRDRTRAVYFANAHTLNIAYSDHSYRLLLNRGDIVFGDGTGVRWAARFRGVELRGNVNGTDLTPALLSTTQGHRLYVLGADPASNRAAVDHLRRTFPAWEVVGHHHGYFRAPDPAPILDDIARNQPDLLLVAMGNPLQERWIDRHRPALDVPVVMAVGGLLDYCAGSIYRAPRWLRDLGMEWLHILWQQPHKTGRYLLGNPAFLYRALTAHRLSLGRTAKHPDQEPGRPSMTPQHMF